MREKFRHNDRRDLVAIAGQASLYEWLIGLGRRTARPRPLPRHLHADLGLAPLEERVWADWR